MFQYEYEKSRRDWSRYPSRAESARSAPSDAGTVSSHSRRALPLPPRPEVICSRVHTTKPTVPLKVWIIASASCFAVCAALVLATVVITKWGTTESFGEHYYEAQPEPVYSHPQPVYHNLARIQKQTTTDSPTEAKVIDDDDDLDIKSEELAMPEDIQFPIFEKLSIFKNIVANRDKKKAEVPKPKPDTLIDKQQIHPMHDVSLHHPERKIQKKDQAKHPEMENGVPEFKPTLPDIFINKNLQIKFPEEFGAGFRKYSEYDNDYFYNDENLYDDYMQSNTMTSYLIEKVQELHDWITTDSDFDAASSKNVSAKQKKRTGNEFTQVLRALNESLVEGNVTIVMNKLKDIYFGENYTNPNHTRKVILSNSTDLLSFGILSLDVMLLHNIQLMAWENQETARNKMLKDPDVFAFNALFLEPARVEAWYNEVIGYREKTASSPKRQMLRQEDEFDIGKNLLENVLEMGMSTARAAIHLGRAYKNTKMVLNQISNQKNLNANIQSLSRNIDGNTHALNHLQTSYNKNDSSPSVASSVLYTELDCVWLLYCKNLAATAKLNAPYGVMARINGMALRMLTGELSADKALDTMLYEALTGWTELRCPDMFPKCSKVNPAKVVMESILQPLKKSQPSNKPS
ncbi:unnamed protein product [Plutella xylostella]|uniref:(diamondback moth) hypothetical protein n=1 Tax=Plutella xylostella TaxID=51655 RepID=A0A8S4EUZ8_PLUXY|nr:unnamed protein product [Plutella xylostella]